MGWRTSPAADPRAEAAVLKILSEFYRCYPIGEVMEDVYDLENGDMLFYMS